MSEYRCNAWRSPDHPLHIKAHPEGVYGWDAAMEIAKNGVINDGFKASVGFCCACGKHFPKTEKIIPKEVFEERSTLRNILALTKHEKETILEKKRNLGLREKIYYQDGHVYRAILLKGWPKVICFGGSMNSEFPDMITENEILKTYAKNIGRLS